MNAMGKTGLQDYTPYYCNKVQHFKVLRDDILYNVCDCIKVESKVSMSVIDDCYSSSILVILHVTCSSMRFPGKIQLKKTN